MIKFKKRNKEDDKKEQYRTNVKLIDSSDAEEINEGDIEAIQLWKIPMAKRPDGKVTKGTVMKALYLANGVLTVAARALGVSRRTIYLWVDKYEDLKSAFEDARSCTADYAENKLIECIDKKHQWAIEMALKYRGDFNDEAITKKDNRGKILGTIDEMLEDGNEAIEKTEMVD